jgi:hypothetical protein
MAFVEDLPDSWMLWKFAVGGARTRVRELVRSERA